MEYEKIRDWLDKLAELQKEQQQLSFFNSQIATTCGLDDIQIHRGIEIVADVMGLSLTETFRKGYEYPYKYSFSYEGVLFIQISTERLPGFERKEDIEER